MVAEATRATIAVVCLVGLLGLCVHYGATEAERSPGPSPEQLDEEYDEHVGEDVLLFGTVLSVDDDEMTVEANGDAAVEVAVTGDTAPDDVAAGGFVQVYGELRPDRSVAAGEIVVVNSHPADEWYKLGASVVGVLVAAAYFLRHWRLSLSRVGWEVRRDG